MSLPALVGLLAFVALPFGTAIVLSLYNVQVNQVRPPTFVGLNQYVRLFTDPVISEAFLRSLLNNVVFAVVVIPLQTGLALALAVLLNRKLRGVRFFRSLFFMPVVFPMALVTVIWRLILDRSSDGLLNASLNFATGGALPAHDWLGSSSTALGSVILLSIWQGVGFQMVIILAGLQEIPEELYEAARIDRANAWQQFLHITVPGVRNTLIFVIMLTTILAFRVYDQVYILIRTAGANEEATQTLLYQATNAISQRQQPWPGIGDLRGAIPDRRRHHNHPATGAEAGGGSHEHQLEQAARDHQGLLDHDSNGHRHGRARVLPSDWQPQADQ